LSSVIWPSVETDAEVCVSKCFHIYRTLQLLSDLYNTTFGHLLVPVWKLFSVVIVPVSLYALIRIRIDSIFVIALVIIFLCSTLAVLIPSAIIMSNICTASMKFRPNQEKRIQQIRIKELRFYHLANLNSFPILWCQVGNFYHIDPGAKLTLLDTVINGLVFLLLTF